jgi:hypothetical protein
MNRIFLTLFSCLYFLSVANAYHINIIAPPSALKNNVSRLAIEDTRDLLLQAGVQEVTINEDEGDVFIILPEVPFEEPLTFEKHEYPYVQVPVRNYHWTGKTAEGRYLLTLKAPGASAQSAALYGLLHEILNFHFYHPRESRLPDLSIWPLKEDLEYTSDPRFNKMGFHLHTQHPLELTEALLNEDFPNGEQRIREYIDWLARNRQNYFEFCLLETINRKKWPDYAARWVQYAKDRGIIPGLDLSLHMKQQVAFKLYRNPHKSFRTKKNQIRKRIDQLTKADWKVFNMEFSQTEFSSGNTEKKAELREFVQQILDEKGIHLTGREHVVKPETMVDKAAALEKEAGKDSARDAQRGVMIHTVMFYTLNDTLAPVYGNKNLHHMRDMLIEEMLERETWYYPESAYWITFDISIPMFLSPYLKARMEDILYCDGLPVEGHLTFSSGWEWGYWLIDWSIANWSWSSTINKKEVVPIPEEYYLKLYPEHRSFIHQADYLQNSMLKTDNLIQFLTAATVTDELPGKFKLPLHPMPEWTYKWLLNDAPEDFVDSILQNVLPDLQKFIIRYLDIRKTTFGNTTFGENINDVVNGLDMTSYRAMHRFHTLSYICKKRLSELRKSETLEKEADEHLVNAAKVREEALQMVKYREQHYRYPAIELTTKHPEKTAYHFGYLFPASNLHFWKRDEEQARQNKWTPFFMNIWKVARIIGLIEK